MSPTLAPPARHARSATGVIHLMLDIEGRAFPKCKTHVELVPLAELPEELSDEALCRQCWPRWSSDIAAGDA